jgi:hypothetical protein
MTRYLILTLVATFTLAAMASSAFAQNPIVAIKVMPEKSVFKDSAWNKPIVIKSQEDAAKHFDKNALEVIAKQVDFKKQIVLVFAWQGSGGDRLSYAILESFPEQVPFSLTPGLTDDIKSHAHVFALRSNVKWSIRDKAKKDGEEVKPAVRQLRFVPKDPTVMFKIGGMSKVTTITSVDAAEKLLGRPNAKMLIDAVNFKSESIVLVSWTTSGPPDGTLKYETKGEGEGAKVTFYVQGPAGGGVRGQRARIGADFFAVPRDTKVAFESKER